jgi:site-specific recombinase XerD
MTKGFSELQNLSQSQGKEQINSLFDQYTKEMRYLRNFSEHTIKGCWRVFTRWLKYVGEMPTEKNLPQFVISMREAGLNTTTCNISITAINSFLTWLKDNGHCPQTFTNGKPFKLARRKEDLESLRGCRHSQDSVVQAQRQERSQNLCSRLHFD